MAILLILVIIHAMLYTIWHKNTLFSCLFVDLTKDVFQSFVSMVVAGILLWIKQDSSLITFFKINVKSMIPLAIIVVSFVGLMIVIVLLERAILAAVYTALKVVRFPKHRAHLQEENL